MTKGASLGMTLTLTAMLLACGGDASDPLPRSSVGGKGDDPLGEEWSGVSMAGVALTEDDRIQISDALEDGPIFEPGDVPDAVFLLHDTAGATSSTYMRGQVANGRGPLGLGPQAWINHEDTFIARPFFYRWRPSSTITERAGDIISLAELADLGRQVWNRTPEDEREQLLQGVLNPVTREALGPDGLDPEEIASEVDGARRLLEATSGRLFTTALWTVEDLVDAGHAEEHPDEDLLRTYFETRNERIERTLHVEMGQLAGGCLNGNPVPNYDDSIYTRAADLYIHSALVAGVFPSVETHFWNDREIRGHCDPRCFDLTRLYQLIAERLGHEFDTRYGVPPSYGTTYGTNTIWWREDACGAPAPSEIPQRTDGPEAEPNPPENDAEPEPSPPENGAEAEAEPSP